MEAARKMQQSYSKAAMGAGQAVRLKKYKLYRKQGTMNLQVVCRSSVATITDMESYILCPSSHMPMNLAVSQNKFNTGRTLQQAIGLLVLMTSFYNALQLTLTNPPYVHFEGRTATHLFL
jgi:hypothetical protein